MKKLYTFKNGPSFLAHPVDLWALPDDSSIDVILLGKQELKYIVQD